jgi:hypothetical protein
MTVLCYTAIFAIPAVLALAWWQFDWLVSNAPEFRHVPFNPESIGAGTRLLGFTVSMLPASFLLCGLYRLARVFRSFSEGAIFTPGTIAGIRTFALMVVLSALARPVATAMLSVVLTMNNPPGERALAITIGSGHLEAVFVGLVFFVIAHLMQEGQRLAEDNAQII